MILVGTFGATFGTRKLFSKKYIHAGSPVNTTHPACCIYHFTLQILQSSAQNPFRAEDFCSIIIEAHYKTIIYSGTKQSYTTLHHSTQNICTYAIFFVPSDICLGFYAAHISKHKKPIPP